jgi:hypothetical protein
MKANTYLGKFSEKPGDLVPNVVKYTCKTEKIPFNETYENK